MKRKIFIAGIALMSLGWHSAFAQRIALKTNLLYWATLSPNFELEARLSPKFTGSIAITGNFAKVQDYQPGFVAVEPELRYWFERPMARHFIGLSGMYTDYDIKWKDMSHTGDAVGAGLVYGYDFVIGRQWNIELSIGAGMARVRDIKYNVNTQQKPESPNNIGWKPALMRAGVTLSYILK